MHVLFWTPPWPVDGDPKFFRQAFRRHLCIQANTLVGRAERISCVVPAQFSEDASQLSSNIEKIVLPLSMSRSPSSNESNLYQKLYEDPDCEYTKPLAKQLKEYLPEDVDVILQWENPVPYLQELYPNALIVNQMPGIFSRPPYPHTVVFDPIGLYRDGAMHRYADDIQLGTALNAHDRALGKDFTQRTKAVMNCFQTVSKSANQLGENFSKKALLPLQSSKHYAFKADSGFDNQVEMLWSVLEEIDRDKATLVTQYRNGLVADTPIDNEIAKAFQKEFPNFIYDAQLENVDSASQYLLPHVDEVCTSSSSLGIQSMVWECDLNIIGKTFLERYASSAEVGSEALWSQRCENTIATLLARHQPLASAVTKDGDFLVALLKALISKKAAKAEGLERLVRFTEIDSDYNNRVLKEFRVDRAARSLDMPSGQPEPSSKILLRFKEILEKRPTKAISFDIFDTLVCRSVEKPADLYRFLERDALELSNGIAADFARVRTFCEVETRNRLKGLKDEITLSDIYETMAGYYGISSEKLSALMDAEIEMEIAHIQVRPFGKKLFDVARNTGCQILLVSDMYLPYEAIERMLMKAGYGGLYDKMYVSCDYDCRKHDGALFSVVLDDLGIPGQEIVHIGDNKRSDIQMAEAKGLRAFRWSASIEWMRSNPEFKSVYGPRLGAGEKARSAVAGTAAKSMFDAPVEKTHYESLSGGDPERLGMAVLGPLITGYMQWLGREAKRDGITDLFFVAREGWLLKEVFDRLHPADESEIKTHYLLGSRRSIRVAACQNAADVVAYLAMPYDPGVPLEKLLEGRFGLTLSSADQDRLEKIGVRQRDLKLDRSIEHRSLLSAVTQEFMSEILGIAATEREAYLSYLKQLGYDQAAQPGIVDVGWKANIQGALGNLTQKRTHGYYYATLQDSETWIAKGDKHRAYSGVVQSGPISKSQVLQNRHLVEFLMCASSQSLVSIKKTKTGFQPVYRPEADLSNRRSLIDPLHQGTIAYASAFYQGFKDHLDQIYIDPCLAEAALTRLFTNPHKLDAKLFSGQAFEDAVGGVEQKFVIAPNRKTAASQSVWKVGAKSVYGAPAKKPKETVTVPKAHIAGPKLEEKLIKRFASARKQAKYERDRAAFFEDSKNRFVQLYWKNLGERYL